MSDAPTTAETPAPAALFEARRDIFPKAVRGPYRRLKWAIMAIALLVYYLTPWLRWDRGPYAPDQAVLIDLANRRFYMFGIEIWPHEFYYVAGLLIMAGIGLFLVTSAVGRAWCGYACPQTVWTDLFQHVERFVDGDRNAQLRLKKAPWSASKALRRVVKHGIWLAIAIATGGAWIFYFADAPALARDFLAGEAPFVAYATVGVLTATTYVLGGLLREQVCIYMCPWPRIQGAMVDENSLLVTYKHWRGEPRSRGLKRAAAEQQQTEQHEVAAPGPVLRQPGIASPSPLAAGPLAIGAQGHAQPIGDCIDCNACVAVCPTGVDIREGSQIGCITCGLCIDACDDIMRKVGRPERLIGYTTIADSEIAIAGGTPQTAARRLFRPRTILYFALWAAIGLAMLFAVGTRDRLDVSVLQSRNPTWVQLSDGHVRNTYEVKIRNMESRPRDVVVVISGIDGAAMWGETGSRANAATHVPLTLAPDQVTKARLFVAAPGDGPARNEVTFTVRGTDGDAEESKDMSHFERPGR